MTNRFYAKSRKLISIVAIVAMVITSISFISVQNNAYAASDTAQVGSYTIALPSGASVNDATAWTEVTKIDSTVGNTLTTGWYAVNEDLEIGQITVEGNVNIILCDDVKLTANSGILVSGDNSLTIWSEMGGTGTLNATGIDRAAGIGGVYGSNHNCGDIIINGGNVNAIGGDYTPAIGCGPYGECHNITINGGNVTAQGGLGGAGIGGGFQGSGNNITITSGNVTATGGYGGAGIGGGGQGSGDDITITGGNVTAIGKNGGAGIGGGCQGSASKIVVEDGCVTANGSTNKYVTADRACGIGVGYGGSGSPSIRIASSLVVEAGKNANSTSIIESRIVDFANIDIKDYSASLAPDTTLPYFVKYVKIYPNDGWNNSAATKPNKTSIKSLSRLKGGFKVTWAKKSNVDGYQILYKTADSSTKCRVTVKSAKTTTKTFKNLKRHTTYNVKVRTYSGKVSNHSAWSKLMSVKTK